MVDRQEPIEIVPAMPSGRRSGKDAYLREVSASWKKGVTHWEVAAATEPWDFANYSGTWIIPFEGRSFTAFSNSAGEGQPRS
jgi:hypothetical protein